MEYIEIIARFLSFWLDGILYNFISTVYGLLIDIAQTSIFTNDIFKLFANKVYALLGVFMLFKVSFSIFTYIVDPDAFLDKSKGFSKLISNIIITLALLLFVPWIFNQAMDIQRIILNDNIIGKVFSVNGVNIDTSNEPGNIMAYETLKAFYHVKNTGKYSDCMSDGNHVFTNESGCESALKVDNFENLKKILETAHNTSSVSIYMDYDLLFMKTSDEQYVMEYIPIISTLAGGAIALLLIVFCFDIAVRSVKIGFLRMLAPVPIISRIDPKKGKDMFDKWVKTCINTYLDLFIRLLGIYFAVFIVTQLIDLKMEDAVTGQTPDINAFVKVFIILGALLFAKQLPKLIEELTGVKMDGKFTLNPLKKLNEVGAVGAGAAIIGSGIANVHAAAKNYKPLDSSTNPSTLRKGAHIAGAVLKGTGSSMAGMGSAFLRGLGNYEKNKGGDAWKTFSDTMMQTSSARVDRDTRQDAGIGVKEQISNKWNQLAGIKNKEGGYGKYNEMIKKYDREIARATQDFQSKSVANGNFITQAGIQASRADTIKSGIYKGMESLFASGKFDIRDKDGNIDTSKEAALTAEINTMLGSFTSTFGAMSQDETTYLDNVVSEARTSLNLAQLQKDRKDAADLTEKVNQVSKK